MARQSGGGGFGAFVIGVIVGVVGTMYGPGLYQKYVLKTPETVRIETTAERTPGQWHRTARFDVEFSSKRADGKDWDWPFTEPELQLCIREGSEYRRCLGPEGSAARRLSGKIPLHHGADPSAGRSLHRRAQ